MTNRALFIFLALALPVAAQETPTEREAARGVLEKMAALEKSLDVPALVRTLTMSNAERDRVTARVKDDSVARALAKANYLSSPRSRVQCSLQT